MDVLKTPRDGDVLDATDTMYPSSLEVVGRRRRYEDNTVTSYGYVLRGKANITAPAFSLDAYPGTFFCMPGEFELNPEGAVVVIRRLGYRGLLAAGRIEDSGRLSYIDGCSSTILVPPPRVGDPVFNHLHFPSGVNQAQHTHPSIRLGIVARGSGIAFGHEQSGSRSWEQPLTEGSVFLLHAQELHAFRTTESGQEMDIITYHPDSDWGPTDKSHPMLTKTQLRSKPAMRT